eukprot:Em0030g11a
MCIELSFHKYSQPIVVTRHSRNAYVYSIPPAQKSSASSIVSTSPQSVAVEKGDDWFEFATVVISELQASSSSPDIVLSSETTFGVLCKMKMDNFLLKMLSECKERSLIILK